MSQGKVQTSAQEGPRVKVYVLGQFSDWEDFGVGHLEFKSQFNAETEQTQYFLSVRSERKMYTHKPLYPKRDREWLLYSKLDISNDYEKQQGTIIRWRDGDLRQELAVSFNDKSKCDQQWRILCEHIGKDHLEITNLRTEDIMEMPTKDNLLYILNTAANRTTAVCFHIINGTEFLGRIISLARQFEENSNTEGLYYLSKIVRLILNYHDTRIIEILFSEYFFQTLLRVLKYSEVNSSHVDYQKIYEERFKFKSLIHFDEVNKERIMTINRIVFYMEMILNLTTEQNLEAYLIRTINSNFSEVFRMMVCTRKFSELAAESRHNLEGVLCFLSELLVDLKAYSQGHEDVKFKILGSFYDQNLTQTLVEVAHNPLPQRQMLSLLEIISVIAFQSERLFFEYLKATYNDDVSLTKILARELTGDSANACRAVTCLLRQLVSETTQKKEFAQFLISTVLHSVAESISKGCRQALPPFLEIILNITKFTDCVVGKLFQKFGLVRLLKDKTARKDEQLNTVQLLKQVLSRKEVLDTELVEQLLSEDILGWLVKLFLRTYRQNNLLSSAMLECFSLLAVNKQKPFIAALLEWRSLLPAGIPVIDKLLSSIQQHEKQVVDSRYLDMLENEKEEKYLQTEDIEMRREPEMRANPQEDHRESLRSIAEEIAKRNCEDDEVNINNKQRDYTNNDQKADPIVFKFEIQPENEENNANP